MTSAIVAAERWLNDGPLPTRHPWRRAAGAAVLLLGAAIMLDSGAIALWHWIASPPSILQMLVAKLG